MSLTAAAAPTLAPAPDPTLDDLTSLAAQVTGAPVALLTLTDCVPNVVASAHGLPAGLAGLREIPASHHLCAAIVETGEPIAIEDARRDARVATNGAVRDWGVVAYAGVPVRDPDAGIVAVLSTAAGMPRAWDAKALASLERVARLAGAELGRRREAAARARADAALHESEARFRALIERAHDMVAVLSLDGTIRYESPAVERVLGYRPDDMIGRPASDFVHPDDLPALGARLAAMAATPGATASLVYRCRHADGGWRTLEAEGWNLTHDPAVGGVVVNARDVTERSTAEVALRESEARYRGLVESAHEGVWAVDAEGVTTYVNPRVRELLGYDADALVGRLWFDFMATDSAFAARTEFARRRRGISEAREYVFRRADGRDLRVMVSSSPLRGARGEFVGALGLLADVTEQRAAETALRESDERLRLALDVARMVVWERDLRTDRIRQLAAPRTAGGAHLSPDRIGDYEGFLAVVHPEDRQRVMDTHAAAVVRGTEFSHEFRITGQGGALLWNHSTARVLLDARGRPERMIGVSMDVTDRVALAEQLRQAQKMEAVGQLAGGVAHDFNNLLTVITSSVRMALDELPPGSSIGEDLAAIDDAAARAAQLTRQLLAFSRKQLLKPEVLDLNRVVRAVEPMLRRLIGEDIAVLAVPAPALRPVLADPGQLEQVLLNLAVNARDAMPGGGRLVIETANVDVPRAEAARRGPGAAHGPHVRLTVRDTGVGMDAATRARVFEPFFTTKEPGKGTGLGLATVYGIVRQSGGHVDVASAPGRGTTFEIDLPAAEVAATAHAPGGSAAGEARRGAGTILLVEDEPQVRAIARRVLARQGYTVLEAEHGSAALAAASAHGGRIDLVLSDVVMPEMSGRAFAERLGARFPGVRVLFMSGYTDDEILRRGLLEPGAAFLEKPFSPSRLLEAVRAALDAPPVSDQGSPL